MSSLDIRRTTSADLDDLARVLTHVHEVDGYPVEGVNDPRSWLTLTNPIGQWTALLDGHAVGHVGLASPTAEDVAPHLLSQQESLSIDDMAVLVRLFVDPAARGGSIATRLISTAVSEAGELGLWTTLDVMEKDRAATRLYEALGWRKIGNFNHAFDGGSVPAIAMRAPRSH
ncbi:GNAT family N-acetyltransferase [Janibacter terrae]|uniref:GNAT family N-acetyltransferase n=1 Tax=Janibacter terrae TaxID=103817 RepID=UPI003BAE5B15